jgi:hypothetical protein
VYNCTLLRKNLTINLWILPTTGFKIQQLTNLDASFLYLESDRTPMHIGCALKFASPVDGEMTFDRFKKSSTV